MPDWVFKIAETAEELCAVYRLRYETLGTELGDTRYCDHDRRFHLDEDDPMSSIIVASCNDQVVATMRVTALRSHSFIAHEVYKWDVLAEVLDLTVTQLQQIAARLDRGAVSSKFRGTGLLPRLQKFAESVAIENGCPVIVGAVAIDNAVARRSFLKVGWNLFATNVSDGKISCDLIYKDLRNRGSICLAPLVCRIQVKTATGQMIGDPGRVSIA